MTPTVSVAMIAYNHRPYIAQAIESVLNQQCDFAVEIVVSDDHSPDGTAEVVAAYARKFPQRVRQVDPGQNLGVAGNLRHAWAQCRGKYIALLEGDDYWTQPEKLARQVALMESQPDCVLCGHAARYDAPEQAALHGRRLPDQNLPSGITQQRLIESNPFPTASLLIRRSVLTSLPSWMSKLKVLDWPIALWISQFGRICFIDEIMSAYRVHGGGVFSTLSELKSLNVICETLEIMMPHAGEPLRSRLRARLADFYHDVFWRQRTLGNYAAARRSLGAELRHRLRLGRLPILKAIKMPFWLIHPGLHWPRRRALGVGP